VAMFQKNGLASSPLVLVQGVLKQELKYCAVKLNILSGVDVDVEPIREHIPKCCCMM